MTKKEKLRLVAFLIAVIEVVIWSILSAKELALPGPWGSFFVGIAFLLLGASNISDPPLFYVVNNLRDQVSPLVRVVSKIAAIFSLAFGILILLTFCWGIVFYRWVGLMICEGSGQGILRPSGESDSVGSPVAV